MRKVVQHNAREDLETDPDEMQRFRELRSLIPDIVAYQKRIWKTLNPKQQRQLRVLLNKNPESKQAGGSLQGKRPTK